MDPILGQIILWPVPWVPRGWALCDGSMLSIQSNQALFSLLGTYYGGDGVTTFQLPDLRNKFPMGAPIVNQIAQHGGAASGSLTGMGAGSVTIGVPNLPAHSHGATFVPGGAVTASVAVPADSNGVASDNTPGPAKVLGNVSSGALAAKLYSTDAPNTTLAPFNVQVPAGSGTVSVADTGSGQPLPVQVAVTGTVPTVPPYQTMNFIIALEGIYPQRP